MSVKSPGDDSTTVITADDLVELPDHDPENSGPNRTDYDLPENWGLYTPEMRVEWFTQERARRQSMNQNTRFKKRTEELKKQLQEEAERLDTDQYRYDDSGA